MMEHDNKTRDPCKVYYYFENYIKHNILENSKNIAIQDIT